MPSWTNNAITLKGEKAKLQEFKHLVAGENGDFDFTKLVALPQGLDATKASHADLAVINKHWGTKWNACKIELTESESSLSYNFATAWDCPRPLVDPIVELAKSLKLSVVWTCDHEDGGFEAIADSEAE